MCWNGQTETEYMIHTKSDQIADYHSEIPWQYDTVGINKGLAMSKLTAFKP